MDRFNQHEQSVIQAVDRACKETSDGWAESWAIVRYVHSPRMVEKYGGTLVAPTLTVLRSWKKPLIEARDGDHHKQYRLTAAGQRACKDSRVSPIPH